MSLSDLASLGAFVSGLAVAASLAYLALQTHQNTKHTRALIQQGRTDRAISALLAWASTDLTTAWLETSGIAATPEARHSRQTSLMFESLLRGSIDSFAQHRDGLLSEEQFGEQCAVIEQMMGLVAFKEYWHDWKAQRGKRMPAFIAFVDGLVPREDEVVSHESRSVFGARAGVPASLVK
jgi:hypothetical protein